MAEDILKTSEKYLFPSKLTEADKEDAPRVIRALAGQLSARSGEGDPVTEAQLVKVMMDAGGVSFYELAGIIMAKFKVSKK